jgi:ketosteroid isomerase-like protein
VSTSKGRAISRRSRFWAISPPNGKLVVRSGYTLTILRKQPDGNWVIARDANLLMPVTTG